MGCIFVNPNDNLCCTTYSIALWDTLILTFSLDLEDTVTWCSSCLVPIWVMGSASFEVCISRASKDTPTLPTVPVLIVGIWKVIKNK